MVLALFIAQVVLVVLDYGAHAISLSPWIVGLPAMIYALLLFIALINGAAIAIDRVNPFMRRRR
jgi:hypothetical protein